MDPRASCRKPWAALGRGVEAVRAADRVPRPWWPLGLVLAFVLFTWLFGNAHEPDCGGDESSLLNVPWRILEQGEVRYPSGLHSAFGSDRLRRFPPLSSFWLRTGFHALFGTTSVAGRTCSALLVLGGLLIGAAALRRLTGAGPIALASYLLLVGLASPVIGAARTIRNEQEVFFLGLAGCLLLPMLQRPDRAKPAALGLWAASGIAIGVAGSSHPWGGCYALVLAGSLLVARRGWAARDGLGALPRLVACGAGVALGVLPTLAGYLVDAEQGWAYLTWQRELYAIRELELIPWMAGREPWSGVATLLGNGPAARLNALDTAAFASVGLVGTAFAPWLRAVFWLGLLAVTARVVLALVRRERFEDPLHPLCLGLALVFPALFALYPPNTTYGLYGCFHVHLAVCVLVWSGRSTAVPLLGLIGCALGLAFAIAFDARVIGALATRRFETLSLDQEQAGLSAAAERAGFAGGPVYTSTESWIAGGEDQRSIVESVIYCLSDVPGDQTGAVFKLEHLESFIVLLGGETGVGPPIAERMRRLERLLAPLALRELVLAEIRVQHGSFLVYAKGPPTPLRVSLLRRDGAVALLEAAPVPLGQDLPAGRYLLLLTLPSIAEKDPILELRVGGQPLSFQGWRHLNTLAPLPIAFEVPPEGARVTWPAGAQALYRLEGW